MDSQTIEHDNAVEAASDTYSEDGVNVVRVYRLWIRETLSGLSVMM